MNLITNKNGKFEFNFSLALKLFNDAVETSKAKSQQDVYEEVKNELQKILMNQNLLDQIQYKNLYNFLSDLDVSHLSACQQNNCATIIQAACDLLPECQKQQQVHQQKFKIALAKLDKATQSNKKDSELKIAGRQVHSVIKKTYEKNKIAPRDLSMLTKFVKGTTDVVTYPTDPKKIQTHAENTEKVIGMNRKWGKLIGGAMLSFLGVALIAASVAVAVATFGGATPLSTAGLTLGVSIIVAGITVSVAAASGAALAVTAGIFADRGRRGNLAVAGDCVRVEAEKISKRKP